MPSRMALNFTASLFGNGCCGHGYLQSSNTSPDASNESFEETVARDVICARKCYELSSLWCCYAVSSHLRQRPHPGRDASSNADGFVVHSHIYERGVLYWSRMYICAHYTAAREMYC